MKISESEYKELISAKNTLSTIQTFNAILAKRRRDKNIGLPHQLSEGEASTAITIQKVKFPETGGTYTVYEDKPYWMKGFCDHESMVKIDEIKRNILIGLKFFSNLSKFKKVLFLIFFKKDLEKIFKIWVKQTWVFSEGYFLEEDKWCDMVQEIRRVWPGNRSHELEDIVSLILEFDDAYRYRFQDAFGNFNQEDFKKKPIKELKKFFKYLEDNEQYDKSNYEFRMDLKSKWRILGKIVGLIRFKPDILDDIIKSGSELDLTKVRMSEEDKYWCQGKFGYNWKKHVSNSN